MRLAYFKFLLVVYSILSGCSENKSRDLSKGTDVELYPDGAYCAAVTYYNQDTDKYFEYTLNVEVKNGKLSKINWGNGGWMDETQFTPTLLDSEGFGFVHSKFSSMTTYSITITGSECLVIDSPQFFRAWEGIITMAQCAANYGASDELFNTYLNHHNLNEKYPITGEDRTSFQDCELLHEKLTAFIRTRDPANIDKGFIQKVFTSTNSLGVICQTMVVQQNGVNYLLLVEGGNTTMGSTTYDPNSDKWLVTLFDPTIVDWQEVIIQVNPEVDGWTVEVARVLLSGSMAELEHYAKFYCNE
uniref:hypothetical protein n=1 Tax=Algoriphagus sp. TaxID=1872435 RepID=UPI004048AC94